MADEPGEPTAEQLADEIKQVDVTDLVLSTAAALGQLAHVKLSANEHDQARIAIDALAALLPPLEGNAGEQVVRELKQLLANVRLAYASAVSAGAATPAPEPVASPEPTPEADDEG